MLLLYYLILLEAPFHLFQVLIFYKDRFNTTIMSLLREFAKGETIYTMNFINGKSSECKSDITANLLLKELDLARILSASEICNFESKSCKWLNICHGGCLHDGFLKSGDFRSKQEATTRQAEVRKLGFSDAFVVAFINGERATIKEAENAL